jgi:hypothetical protein
MPAKKAKALHAAASAADGSLPSPPPKVSQAPNLMPLLIFTEYGLGSNKASSHRPY